MRGAMICGYYFAVALKNLIVRDIEGHHRKSTQIWSTFSGAAVFGGTRPFDRKCLEISHLAAGKLIEKMMFQTITLHSLSATSSLASVFQ
jgi:hypothetical protein